MDKWLFKAIGLVIGVLTPEVRNGAESLLDQLAQKAKATPNPWDDLFVDMLRQIILGK